MGCAHAKNSSEDSHAFVWLKKKLRRNKEMWRWLTFLKSFSKYIENKNFKKIFKLKFSGRGGGGGAGI